MRTMKRMMGVPLALVLVIGIIFIPVLMNGRVIYWGTVSLQFVPWMKTGIDLISGGHFPLWNPWNGFGAPLFANYQSAFLYPLNWVLIIFYKLWGIAGLQHGYTILYVVHLMIAASGMSYLLKELHRSQVAQFLGGFVWVFGGYVISRISFISMVWSFAWISWMLFCVIRIRNKQTWFDRRYFFLLTIFTGLQLLSGHAQTTFFTFMLVGVLTIFPLKNTIRETVNDILNIAVALISAVCISAIQLMPTLEYLTLSQRSSAVGYEYATNYSFWPLRIFSLFFGGFWGNPGLNRYFGGGTFWEDQIYHGVIPILLIGVLVIGLFRNHKIIFEKKDRNLLLVLGVLAILAFLLSAGKNLVIFPFLYKYVPIFRLFQAPSRFLLLFTFALVLVGMYGFDYWGSHNFKVRKVGLLISVSLAIFLSMVIIILMDIKISPEMVNSVLWSAGIILVFSFVTILKTIYPEKRVLFTGLIVVLIIVDLVVVNFPYGHFENALAANSEKINNAGESSEQLVYMDTSIQEFLKFSRFYRFDRFQPLDNKQKFYPVLLPNNNLLASNFGFVNNFDPFVPKNYDQFMQWLAELSEQDQISILQHFGVKEIAVLDVDSPSGIAMETLKSEKMVQWYQCSISVAPDEILDEILYNVTRDNQKWCIFLNGENATSISPLAEPEIDYKNVVEFHRLGSDYIIQYSSEQDGWLAIRQTWFPGWEAKLEDGRLLPVKKADFLFQAVGVPAGSHTLTLSYHPKSVRIGAIVSVISLVIFFVFLLIPRLIKKRY